MTASRKSDHELILNGLETARILGKYNAAKNPRRSSESRYRLYENSPHPSCWCEATGVLWRVVR
jgi:hypothetical protein